MSSKDHDTKESKQKFEIPKPVVGRTKADYNFAKTFINIYQSQPFLGVISMGITKREDWSVPTAYVGWDSNLRTVVMGYNPEFMYNLENEHKEGVGVHEILHVVFHHIMDRAPANRRDAKLWNVAADITINPIVGKDKLPDWALYPGRELKNCDDPKLVELVKSFPENQSAEWYYARLKEYVEERDKESGGTGYDFVLGDDPSGGSLDSHEMWGGMSREEKDEINSQIREMIEKGARNAQKHGWGNTPAHLQELIKHYLSTEIDWKSVLRHFFGTARSMERESTIKRINKKMPYIFPGTRRKTTAKFAAFIDQSGSMSDEDVAMAFSAIADCSRETEIDVYNFDTEVDEASHKLWKRGSKISWMRTRCGGTNFNSIISFMNKPENRNRWSGVLILTDGYADKLGYMKGAKVLWLITPGGTMEAIRQGDLVIQMKKDATVKRFGES